VARDKRDRASRPADNSGAAGPPLQTSRRLRKTAIIRAPSTEILNFRPGETGYPSSPSLVHSRASGRARVAGQVGVDQRQFLGAEVELAQKCRPGRLLAGGQVLGCQPFAGRQPSPLAEPCR
jgi:hypothetical protein